jgi:hypothetical protein
MLLFGSLGLIEIGTAILLTLLIYGIVKILLKAVIKYRRRK